MSTAVAYPPSHSSSRPSSNPPDIHGPQSSSAPRTYQPIAPAQPDYTGLRHLQRKQQATMTSSPPPQPSSSLAPRRSSELVRPVPHNATNSSPSLPARVSPQAQKTTQQPQNASDSSPSQSSQIVIPSVEVKTERPTTPDPKPGAPALAPASRHRPRKLDLTTTVSVPPGRPSAPMTSKDSAPLTAMQDIALSCLSPGFQTEDPRMTQQLQRSMDLREQQRQIIEARLNKGGKEGESSAPKGTSDQAGPQTSAFSKNSSSSKRKGPPPGLSIKAPSAHHFAGEPRVIQSAPLNQSFTGLHNKPGLSHVHPLSRQVHESSIQPRRPSDQAPPPPAASTSQQYAPYVSTPQTATRLPPIQDVFANDNIGSSPYRPSHTLNRANSGPGGSSPRNGVPASPAYPPPPQSAGFQPPSHAPSRRESDFKSADEAVRAISGGRDELLPKIVHYGGHQPPTPPSPLPPSYQNRSGEKQHPPSSSLRKDAGVDSRSGSGRRRTRDEYERDYDDRQIRDSDRMDIDGERERGRPAKGNTDGAAPSGQGLGFGFGSLSSDEPRRRSPESMRRKKEEFLALCSRAWDLLHE